MGKLLKRKESIFLILILLLASFMRLYRISDYMTFLGDEGRDVLTVYGILQGDLVFLGPRSSAADFFYGPIYFYLITPFLWLFRYDPVGPAVFVALVGIATVFLVYFVGKKFFNGTAGLFASALYAVSPLVINYSHSSWNPNPMPFVSLLLIFTVFYAVQKKSLKLFFAVGVLFGVAMQMQYIAMFLAAIIFFYALIGSYIAEKKIDIFELLKSYLAISAGFAAGISMFLAFEIKNNFPNTRTIINFIFFGSGQQTNTVELFANIPGVFFQLFSRLLLRFPPPEQLSQYDPGTLFFWQAIVLIIALSSLFALRNVKNVQVKILMIIWFVCGVVLFGFYRKVVYDYYLGFLFPLPFLLFGNALSVAYHAKKITTFGKIFVFAVFAVVFFYNLAGMPFRYEPNRQKDQVRTIAEFVLSKTDGKPYNFALITPGNSDHAYRYYFLINNRPPVTIENEAVDPDRTSVTDQLLVVCEDVNCKPLGHPLFEVAGFGRAEIVGEWDVSVVKVFKLKHYEAEEKKD